MIDKSQDRYFLMCYGEREAWTVIDNQRQNFNRLRHDGSPDVDGAVCLESAMTLPALLGKLWASGDENVYVRMDWVSSRGATKRRNHPYFYNDLHQLTGYVEDVCEITRGQINNLYKEKWRVEFPGDLWIMTDGSVLMRVLGFDTLMRAAVDDYIREEGLAYDDDAEEPW